MSTAVDPHPTAVVADGAELAEGAIVGPYVIVGENVRVGPGTRIGPHAVVEGHTSIGAECVIFPHACVGTIPQDLKFKGEVTYLEVGDRNVFREFVTVNVGTEPGGGITRIGSDNLFMAYTHIAHDCLVGSHSVFANAATLAGHVTIEDWAIVGAFCGIQQFCRIGQHAFLAAYAGVHKDVAPYASVEGNHAKTYGLNSIGLCRRDFSSESIGELKRAFRLLFRNNLNTTQALEAIGRESFSAPEVATLVDFVRSSERGIVK